MFLFCFLFIYLFTLYFISIYISAKTRSSTEKRVCVFFFCLFFFCLLVCLFFWGVFFTKEMLVLKRSALALLMGTCTLFSWRNKKSVFMKPILCLYVVYGDGNDFRIQKIKLVFVLIDIIIEKDNRLSLSRRENVIFAVIDTCVLEFPQDIFSSIFL